MTITIITRAPLINAPAPQVTICGAGLRAVTREHGLTEYWAHRVTYCAAHPAYPRVFCWVYRHEGRRLKQELRCHAVLCPKTEKAEVMMKYRFLCLYVRVHQERSELLRFGYLVCFFR